MNDQTQQLVARGKANQRFVSTSRTMRGRKKKREKKVSLAPKGRKEGRAGRRPCRPAFASTKRKKRTVGGAGERESYDDNADPTASLSTTACSIAGEKESKKNFAG